MILAFYGTAIAIVLTVASVIERIYTYFHPLGDDDA